MESLVFLAWKIFLVGFIKVFLFMLYNKFFKFNLKKFVTTNMFNCHNTIAYWGLLDFLCSLTSFWGAQSAKMKRVKHKFQEKCFMKQNLAQNIVRRKKNPVILHPMHLWNRPRAGLKMSSLSAQISRIPPKQKRVPLFAIQVHIVSFFLFYMNSP